VPPSVVLQYCCCLINYCCLVDFCFICLQRAQEAQWKLYLLLASTGCGVALPSVSPPTSGGGENELNQQVDSFLRFMHFNWSAAPNTESGKGKVGVASCLLLLSSDCVRVQLCQCLLKGLVSAATHGMEEVKNQFLSECSSVVEFLCVAIVTPGLTCAVALAGLVECEAYRKLSVWTTVANLL